MSYRFRLNIFLSKEQEFFYLLLNVILPIGGLWVLLFQLEEFLHELDLNIAIIITFLFFLIMFLILGRFICIYSNAIIKVKEKKMEAFIIYFFSKKRYTFINPKIHKIEWIKNGWSNSSVFYIHICDINGQEFKLEVTSYFFRSAKKRMYMLMEGIEQYNNDLYIQFEREYRNSLGVGSQTRLQK